MIVMNESSVSIVSISDILCSICRLTTAVAIEGATRGLTMNESRQYFRPLPMPLGVWSEVASCSFLKGKKCGSNLSF